MSPGSASARCNTRCPGAPPLALCFGAGDCGKSTDMADSSCTGAKSPALGRRSTSGLLILS